MVDTQEAPSEHLTCPACQARLNLDARFCGMCGEKLPQEGEFKADSLVGKVLAKGAYRVDALLGTGSMGVVYRAEQVALGRLVALKVIGESASDETTRARFRREARAASQLGHPNVVQIYDFGQLEGGQPYLAMELLQGRTLEVIIQEDFPLSPDRILAIMRDVLSALHSAHEMGILHRDLKPANVFVSVLPDGRELAKVLDFGVATAMDNTLNERKTWAPLTEAGFVCGTPAFMSPEQVQGFALDQRSDLFSAGAMLYQVLTAERPFPGKSPVEVGANIVLRAADPPAMRRPDLRFPDGISALIDRAMAKEAADRYPDAMSMLRALEEVYHPNRFQIRTSPGRPIDATNGGEDGPAGSSEYLPPEADPEIMDTIIDHYQLVVPSENLVRAPTIKAPSQFVERPIRALDTHTNELTAALGRGRNARMRRWFALATVAAGLLFLLLLFLLDG